MQTSEKFYGPTAGCRGCWFPIDQDVSSGKAVVVAAVFDSCDLSCLFSVAFFVPTGRYPNCQLSRSKALVEQRIACECQFCRSPSIFIGRHLSPSNPPFLCRTSVPASLPAFLPYPFLFHSISLSLVYLPAWLVQDNLFFKSTLHLFKIGATP